MPKFFKQLLNFIRQLLGLENDQNQHNRNNYNLNLFNGAGRLAQSANAPGAAPRPALGSYAGQSANPKRHHKYSVEEIKRILRGEDHGENSAAVLAAAATFASLLDERMIRYFRGRERLFERLPYVLYQYIQGRPCEDIAHSVSFFSDSQDVEDAIDFAARLIALQLNKQR